MTTIRLYSNTILTTCSKQVSAVVSINCWVTLSKQKLVRNIDLSLSLSIFFRLIHSVQHRHCHEENLYNYIASRCRVNVMVGVDFSDLNFLSSNGIFTNTFNTLAVFNANRNTVR